MSSVPPLSFPTLNLMDSTVGQSLGAAPSIMDPMNINLLSGMTDTTMEDVLTMTPRVMDPCASGASPFPPRAIDPGYMHHMMYALNFAHNPMGPMPYMGNGPTGTLANTNGPGLQLANNPYTKIESISDLVLPTSLDFEYSPELNAVLHAGKCPDCIHFGLHIIMPGNRAKFLCATSAHSNAVTAPLCAEVEKLTQEARIASKNLKELKDALQSSQQLATSLRAEQDAAWNEHDEVLMDLRAASKRVKDLEQQPIAAPYRRPSSPIWASCHHSPPRSGSHSDMLYECANPPRMGPTTNRRHQTPTPVILEPDNNGDVIMTSFPTNIRSMRMHRDQLRYNNRRPCPIINFRWKSDNGLDVIGLPKTQAGTPYVPNNVGLGWCALENNATSINKVYRHIDLLFHNRQEEIWRAATRSAFKFRQIVEPVPKVMEHFLQLHNLRKSVWAIVNDGVASGADLSIISPGCRLHNDGYAGLYTLDVQLWATIHALTDINTSKLSTRTRCTVTITNFRKMVKDALCLGNYFEIAPTELAKGKYELPQVTHYDGPLDMNTIIEWLRTTIGMTPYMVHAHFRPFLHRAFETTEGARHQTFSPTNLLPREVLPPKVNDTLADFAAERKWTPNRGP
jgi:hypothetical protein